MSVMLVFFFSEPTGRGYDWKSVHWETKHFPEIEMNTVNSDNKPWAYICSNGFFAGLILGGNLFLEGLVIGGGGAVV